MWKVTEISKPSQCRSSRLPDNTSSLMRVTNLVYTNSGHGVLALAANAVHKLWKWPKNDRNTSGKATTSMLPQLWQPTSGILMTNDISDTNPEDSIACFKLSKNDSYVISASGGKISLFNMMTFKIMTAFMPPPPVAIFLAFDPQDNNIVAIGMDNASIQIFSVRLDEVENLKDQLAKQEKVAKERERVAKELQHASEERERAAEQRVCGLKWSYDNHELASCGNDNRIFVWNQHLTQPVLKYCEHTAAVKVIAWSPHVHGLLASGGGTADRCIRFWNTTTNSHLSCMDTCSQVCNLVWSKNVNELMSTPMKFPKPDYCLEIPYYVQKLLLLVKVSTAITKLRLLRD